MKLSEFSLKLDKHNNISIIGPKGFCDIADNEQYLTNHNLAYILLLLKTRLNKEDWEDLKNQIMEI